MEIIIRIYPNEILKKFSHYTPIFKIIKILKPKKILEIRCYKGYFVKFLREQGYDAYGIDPEAEKSEFLIKGFYEEYEFKEKFDLIFARFSLQLEILLS